MPGLESGSAFTSHMTLVNYTSQVLHLYSRDDKNTFLTALSKLNKMIYLKKLQ